MKYNKKEIMKRAWETYRNSDKTFSESLKEAWKIEKMTTIGNLWEKYGKRRIYFDQETLLDMFKIKIESYKSGNISYASLNGEKISNSEGYRWLGSTSSVYFDLISGKFYGTGSHVEEVINAIRGTLNV